MIRLFYKTLLHDKLTYRYFLQTRLISLKSFSTSTDQHLFRVSYLINSCGFSPESALSASNYLHFETADKPDSVIAFLQNHGFTKTQVSKLIRRAPPMILSDPEKTLLPKFDFFYSVGLSRSDLAKAFSSNPNVLRRSLKNKIIPAFNFLESLLHDNVKIIAAFKRFPGIFVRNLETVIAPNVAILRELGVPESNIIKLFTNQPRAFMKRSVLFNDILEEVKRMGFNPLRMKFLLAVLAMTAMSKSTWERKLEVYRKWNWSEREIVAAFGRNQCCMTASEDKIMAVMDYYVNTVGWEASAIANRPLLLSLSLKKRIVPRCSVLQVLLSKGLIKKGFSLTTLLETSEKLFLLKFVNCYEEEAPQLLKLYQEKMDLSRVG